MGGDPIAEDQLLRRAMALRKSRTSSTDPCYIYLRGKHLDRLEKQQRETKATEERDHELELLKGKAKLQTALALKMKASGRRQALDWKQKSAETVARRKELKAAAQAEAEESEIRQRYYASWLATRLRKHWHDRDAERIEIEAKVEKRIRHAACVVPNFWLVNVDILTDVSLKEWTLKPKKPIYASKEFASSLFHGPQEDCKTPDPLRRFSALIIRVLPGYMTILGATRSPATLIAHNNSSLDLAFLEGVWRYTEAVGGLKNFPKGIDEWPPKPTWRPAAALTATASAAASPEAAAPKAKASASAAASTKAASLATAPKATASAAASPETVAPKATALAAASPKAGKKPSYPKASCSPADVLMLKAGVAASMKGDSPTSTHAKYAAAPSTPKPPLEIEPPPEKKEKKKAGLHITPILAPAPKKKETG